MKFTMPWGRKRMKKEELEKLKKMTLVEFKQKYPRLVESIRAGERAKLYGTMEKAKLRIKEIKEEIKKKKEARQELTESLKIKKKGLEKEKEVLEARHSELLLAQQARERADLIKKKLKNMPSSLQAILEPVLSGCSSSEDMDKEINQAIKLYQATHPGEPQAGIIEKKEWTQKEIEAEKERKISEAFDEAFS